MRKLYVARSYGSADGRAFLHAGATMPPGEGHITWQSVERRQQGRGMHECLDLRLRSTDSDVRCSTFQ